ncbi:MFS transporter [Corynebacterium sp. MNWGS58]|uniref:MFS transporter n=1 Tax=Corynebacterium sp. 102791.4 TaxID=3104612 RepID=UPI003516146E
MTRQTKGRRLKDLVAVNFGNILEWYDWNIYTIFAPYFAAKLFIDDDPASALLSTLAVFAIGFIARPVGGFVFGRFADKAGRKQALFLAMMLTAGGSLVIGMAPTAASVGVWAAVILVGARLLQGLAHGGEMGTSMTYLVERAPNGKRALFGSTSWVSVVMGTMLATIIGLLLNIMLDESMIDSWGWRVPFLIGGVLGLYALWLRKNIVETSESRTSTNDAISTAPLAEKSGIFGYWRGLLLIFVTSAGGSLMFYNWLLYLPTHAQIKFEQSPDSTLAASLVAQVIFLLMILLFGYLGDKVGRKPLVIGFSAGFIALTIPFYSILSGSFITLVVAMVVSLTVLAMLFGINGALWAESLPTKYRATGVATTLSLATAMFGGTAPYVNQWLSNADKDFWFQIYLIVVASVTLLAGLFAKETKDKNLS